jgi:hypothetical protein
MNRLLQAPLCFAALLYVVWELLTTLRAPSSEEEGSE